VLLKVVVSCKHIYCSLGCLRTVRPLALRKQYRLAVMSAHLLLAPPSQRRCFQATSVQIMVQGHLLLYLQICCSFAYVAGGPWHLTPRVLCPALGAHGCYFGPASCSARSFSVKLTQTGTDAVLVTQTQHPDTSLQALPASTVEPPRLLATHRPSSLIEVPVDRAHAR
jgi:hypothetical protein